MFVALKKYSNNVITKQLEGMLAKFSFSFNPSYLEHKGTSYFSIRIFDDILNEVIAMLYIWDENTIVESINLSEFFKEKESLNKVADPKLFALEDTVYCTFNTGYSPSNANQVLLLKLESRGVSDYSFCNYKNRTRVEKNWAFYVVNSQLYCIYSLYPLIILKANEPVNKTIEFDNYYSDNSFDKANYTIGTPIINFNDKLLFIAHKKISKRGKRIYLGKPFLLKLGETPKLLTKNTYLFHSLKALFGSKHKFNKNLFSCTYFSGISKLNDKICLSYGVNDVSWNTVLIELKYLWH